MTLCNGSVLTISLLIHMYNWTLLSSLPYPCFNLVCYLLVWVLLSKENHAVESQQAWWCFPEVLSWVDVVPEAQFLVFFLVLWPARCHAWGYLRREALSLLLILKGCTALVLWPWFCSSELSSFYQNRNQATELGKNVLPHMTLIKKRCQTAISLHFKFGSRLSHECCLLRELYKFCQIFHFLKKSSFDMIRCSPPSH